MRSLGLIILLLIQPATALACGGFFCNNATPVVQSAERIVFIPHEGNIHMHVRITYSGPRDDFGWLLPTSPGVQVQLSTERIFNALDNLYAPQFRINRIFDPECDFPVAFASAESAAFDDALQEGGAEPSVTVVSRQAVGPYDNAILEADTVEVLRIWLDENGFQIPPAIDEKLGPYVEAGAQFVAIKLRAGQDTGDIAPLYLNFPGNTPAIPIVPTSVAADPDMGILVHVMGDARAVPANYLHVQINEAALDLNNGGQNYVDVVSQAVDEAGGQAFVTDFAGSVNDSLRFQIEPIDMQQLQRNETIADLFRNGLWNDPDFQRVGKNAIALPDGAGGEFDGEDYWDCAPRYTFFNERSFDDEPEEEEAPSHPCGVDPNTVELDTAALWERIEAEINPSREHLMEMAAAHPYVSRLYSTMSPNEMTLDPEFIFNADLETVDNVRSIDIRIPCDGDQPMESGATLVNSAGIEVEADLSGDAAVFRMNGETVQGMSTAAAAVIERTMAAGPTEVIGMMGEMMGTGTATTPTTPPFAMPTDPMGSAGVSANDDAGGCYGCSNTGRNADTWAMLGLLLLGLGMRRRRETTNGRRVE